jgi:hypothetical protein
VKSAKTITILVLALTTVGGAMLAWQQYQELVELRAAAMNKDERAAMQKRIWDLERFNKELNDQLAALRDGSDLGDLAIAGGSTGRGGDTNGGRGNFRGRGGNNPMQMANTIRNLMAKPEVQALVTATQKARIDAQYAALFRNLNLSPDQAAKVESLLADRANTMQDVMNVAREQGINPRTDPQGFQQLVASAQSDINNSLQSVLGAAGFSQLQSYEQTMPQQNVVNQLQQRLSYTDTPLTPAQSAQLVQVLAANPAPLRTNADGTPAQVGRGGAAAGIGAAIAGVVGGGFGGGGGGGGIGALLGGGGGGGAGGGANAVAIVTPAAVAQAQTVLAPTQVAALQQIQQQQQNQQQLAQIVSAAIAAQNQNAGGGANSGTTGGTTTSGGGARKKGGG